MGVCGDLNNQLQLRCVYKSSEDAQNGFLEDPKWGIGENCLDNEQTGKMVKDNLTEAQKKMVLDMREK